MKFALRPVPVFSALLLFLLANGAAHGALTHRYSFADGAKDSVGQINGLLKGRGAMIANGKLHLTNDQSASGDQISFLEFSAPLLPKTGTSVSLVVWFTARDVGEFARVINFGDSEGTEGKQFIYFSPHIADGQARSAITATDVGAKTALDLDSLADGKPHCVALVIDGAAKKLRVFVDGAEPKSGEDLGENTLDKVKPVQNWLGKSSFAADPGLTGSIDEFRVYDHALNATEASAIFKAGADALPSTPAASQK